MAQDHQASARQATIDKFVDIIGKWNEAQRRIEIGKQAIAEGEAMQARLQEDINRCHAAAALFGFDLMAATTVYIEQQSGAVSSSGASPAPPQAVTTAAINVKDFVLDAAQRAYPKPIRAAVLRRQLQEAGRIVHEKTIGMTLYRLLKQGLIRRDGFDWYYVHEIERDEASTETMEASLFH